MNAIQDLFDQISAAGAWLAILQLLLILIVTIFVLRFGRGAIRAAIGRLSERDAPEAPTTLRDEQEQERRRRTVEDLGYQSLRVVIVIIAALMALQVLRLDIGPAIAGLGVAGLALSLGAQNLVRDYVAGAFVLIENQYSEGDVVTVAGVCGTVEDISLRRTTLRSIDGTLHSVPHGLIDVSSNLTRTWARVAFDVPVAYGTDIARLAEVIDQAGRDLAADPEWAGRVPVPPTFLRAGELREYGMAVKVLGTVRAVDRWDATGEMRRRIIDGAREAGIQLGWPTEASDTIASQVNPALPSRRQR